MQTERCHLFDRRAISLNKQTVGHERKKHTQVQRLSTTQVVFNLVAILQSLEQLLVDCFEKETQRSATVSSLILEAAATELL